MAVERASETVGAEGILLQQFQAFYRQVLEVKRRLGIGDLPPPAREDEGTEGPGEPLPDAVRRQLVTLLERQALEQRRGSGDFAGEVYSQAQYLMAALADEIFLNLRWSGAEYWRQNLLETRLFHSHSAGDTVFERLDELLASQDPVHFGLARLYLTTLALGFQGKYRDQDGGDAELAHYRRRLLTFITQRDADLLEGRERFFPAAYASTLDEGDGGKLPYLRKWVVALVVLLGLWVLGSGVVWHQLTDDLRPLLEQIGREEEAR